MSIGFMFVTKNSGTLKQVAEKVKMVKRPEDFPG
jgi:hypothetical protein